MLGLGEEKFEVSEKGRRRLVRRTWWRGEQLKVRFEYSGLGSLLANQIKGDDGMNSSYLLRHASSYLFSCLAVCLQWHDTKAQGLNMS